MRGFMLDTNVFNHLLDGEIEPQTLVGRCHLCATHIQINEIQRTPNKDRREALLSVFAEISSEQIPTSSAVYGVSEYGNAEWDANDGLFESLLASLNKKNNKKKNNSSDILIAETAIRRGLNLVTDDVKLSEVFQEYGGRAIGLTEFRTNLNF